MAKGKKCFTKQKKIVVFNEDARREYLLGFSKRKKERKQRAMDALKKKHVQELQEIKQKKRDELLESLRKQQEEYDAMQSDDDDNEGPDDTQQLNATYDHPEHTVTVTTVCDVDLSGGSTTIGVNKELSSTETLDNMKQINKDIKQKHYDKKNNNDSKKKKFSIKKRNQPGSVKFKAKKKRRKIK